MALLDAYATKDEYRAAVGSKATGTDTTLDAQLTAMTRQTERSLQVAPGGFNSHAGTYTFDAHGGQVLWLRDSADLGYFLQSITADSCGIDIEEDGTFDYYTLDLGDAWLRGLPEHAATFSEPYIALQLLAHRTNAEPTEWPDQPASVRIAGTWGWAAVPRVIKELVIHRTHELREALKGGALEAMTNFEGTTAFPAGGAGVPMGQRTF
ncbi:MAG TPA: hypothetical protein PLX85_10025, partial [Dehalococcoidia bacterium]|nr:hypothetical protein [Dehalococcoidia bacterium]